MASAEVTRLLTEYNLRHSGVHLHEGGIDDNFGPPKDNLFTQTRIRPVSMPSFYGGNHVILCVWMTDVLVAVNSTSHRTLELIVRNVNIEEGSELGWGWGIGGSSSLVVAG